LGDSHELLENEVVPLFYEQDADSVPRGWAQVMKEAIRTSVPIFCTRRMVKEYAVRLCIPVVRHQLGAEAGEDGQ
jgi:starch phosphorylase